MQLNDTLRSLIRRWYIVVLGLLVTVGLGWTAYNMVPTKYQASTLILLMPPEATVGEDANPYLFLGGMTDPLDVLIRRANDEEVRGPIIAQFTGADYAVTRDATTSSPIVIITADATDPEASMQLLAAGTRTVNEILVRMQEEVDVQDTYRITSRNLIVAQEPTADTKSQIQLSLAAMAAGVLGTFMATGLVDGILKHRKMRKDLPSDATEGAVPVIGSGRSVDVAHFAPLTDPVAEQSPSRTASVPPSSSSSDDFRFTERGPESRLADHSAVDSQLHLVDRRP